MKAKVIGSAVFEIPRSEQLEVGRKLPVYDDGEVISSRVGCYMNTVHRHNQTTLLETGYQVTQDEHSYNLNVYTTIPIYSNNERYKELTSLMEAAV